MIQYWSLPMYTFVVLLFFLTVDILAESDVNCSDYKNNLANALASFTSCSVMYSRPITFCEQCVNEYIEVLNSYHNLSVVKDASGTLCIDDYVNLDRLQIVKSMYDNNKDLWNRAKCYECFQIVNGKITNNSSREIVTFNKYFNQLENCINRTDVNETTLCATCSNAYVQLNDYYISISNENEKIGVCMDIVDLMNGTRAFWSDKCCKFKHKDERVFIFTAITVILITLTFYVSTKWCSEKKTPVLLKQNRFAGSLTNHINNCDN